RTMSSASDIDPLSIAWAPPPDESPEARAERLREEEAAQRVSDAIDESLRQEKASLKKRTKPVKILLLGQAESGKSTTLKNLQMTYAPAAWARQRASWRAVIQLNLIHSINLILDILASVASTPSASSSSTHHNTNHSHNHHYSHDDEQSFASHGQSSGNASGGANNHNPLTEKHALLRLRLAPLRREGGGGGGGKDGRDGRPSVADEATEVLMGCAEDMKALWEDGTVRGVLEGWGIRLSQWSGFFLDDIDRIASRSYTPSDADVVRARLRTIGIQEHSLVFEDGIKNESGGEWTIYDVGGCRTSRHAWLPYFEDLTSIIFLVPISCFDEQLEEDQTVNRLQDSFALWTAIVGSKLLSDVMIILFLNKCDLLDQKLRSGVMLNHFLTSFGERSNTTGTVVKYLRSKFKDILIEKSPKERPFYGYPTSVVDTMATRLTLGSVRDGILRSHLKNADFL
ncbi:G-alpha-domain-containing protein, partial [Stereum hirsutum FP-91666 SS1]|uniref:G-alpha-domain-containing protein n=1 Tax=Stereum hirsutum (strain FP-91666) TaxID=721885 RepID=UPI0004449352